MDTLPIKLNFFKRAEQFLEISSLDRQFDLMMKKYDFEETNKDKPHCGVSINLPTWNIEKKILYWSFLNHKHLGSPISTAYLEKESFQKDIKTTDAEIKFANSQNILNNLVAHGFADEISGGVKLNSNGLLVGSILNEAYFYQIEKKLDFEYLKSTPRKFKKIGFYLLYFTAWLLIFEAISYLVLQLISIVGLLDNIKNIFPKYISGPVIMIFFFPLLTLSFGIFLIKFPFYRKKS